MNTRSSFLFGSLALAVTLLLSAQWMEGQSFTVLYNFTGNTDGPGPDSHLTLTGGNLYGTTNVGGLGCSRSQYGCGTIFELSPNGIGGWDESTLYSFTGATDGANPNGPLIFDNQSNIYGTTSDGGQYGYGVVFKLSLVQGNWMETTLYAFADTGDGAFPNNGVLMDKSGNFYGRTSGTGEGEGNVFKLSQSGGGWTEQVIYVIGGTGYCCDQAPSGLAMDATGNIFGASSSTVFELSSNGNGGWDPKVIATFTSGFPMATPVIDATGNIYSTVLASNAYSGTVYKLSPTKKGNWTKKSLYTVSGNPGFMPGIVLDPGGNIFGISDNSGTNKHNLVGTVFELVLVGKNSYQAKILWSNSNRAFEPYGSIVLDNAGEIYGTSQGGDSGYGLVFEVTP
jgi:hypothetical protein